MTASRIANVSAALLIGSPGEAAKARRLAGALSTLFEDTLWIDATPPPDACARFVRYPDARRDPASRLAAAILAARGERVIVVAEEDPLACAELALALVAWPERAVVLPADAAGDHPLSAIYRRAELAPRLRDALESEASPRSLDLLLAGLEVERVSPGRLGLAVPRCPLFRRREAS